MKKLLAALLALTMVVSVGGCGTKQTSTDGEVPTLTWYVPGTEQADLELINEAASKITEEKIGAEIKISFIDEGAYTEKMSMINAASEKYDLCFTGYLNNYANNADDGALYDITDMLKDTPALVESLPEFVWDAAKIDDRIYAVPNYQILVTTTGLSINKELADKYNFDVTTIQKTEDIEPLLKAVAENEPNMYPFRTNWGVASFVDKDEDHSNKGQTAIGYAMVDGKVTAVNGFEIGDTKKHAQILRNWYEKGYIREDAASVMDDSQEARAGKYAVQATAYKPGVEAEDKIYMGGDVYSVSLSKPVLAHSAIRATMIGIGANSKNPEKALKFIELVNTGKELYNLICFGIEGKHYTKVGENRIELPQSSGYRPNASWKFGNQFNAYLMPDQADDVWEETMALNASAVKACNFGFEPNYDKVRTQYTQCNTVYSKYKVMNSGAMPTEEYYANFETELKEAGIDELLAGIQIQLDEFFNQN